MTVFGLANGCFDLLHAGHRYFLAECRCQCDHLTVVVNGDESVRRLKGQDRPVQNLATRIAALRGLPGINSIQVFHEDTPEEIIRLIAPDVLFKGGDYTVDEVVGRQYARRVVIIPRLPGYSTTEEIAK